MSRVRSIRLRGKRRKKEAMEIDITSLLDILVILLVFLIRNYSSTEVILNVPKDVKLPFSNSASLSTAGIQIQVSPTTIWVDDTVVLERDNLPPNYLDMQGRRIIPLYNELRDKIQKIKEIDKATHGKHQFSGVVNLLVDKTIKYSYIKKLMFTAAEAGFRKYKFVVMGEDE